MELLKRYVAASSMGAVALVCILIGLLGVTVLKGLEYAGDNEWEDGSIYSPDNGKTYSARATLTDENTLEARGYLGISLLGRSQTWQRVDRDAPNLETDLLK